jgi:UDP-N-acetyl-D-mannosaminuronic acid transferase (WecB/TagA/CpsF family)
MFQKVPMLNIQVDDVTMDDLLSGFWEGALLTVRVETIVRLQKDAELYRAARCFDVVACDSQLLLLAARAMGYSLTERVSGARFLSEYCLRNEDDPQTTIFLCGGTGGAADDARRRMNEQAGREMVVGAERLPGDLERRPEALDELVEKIDRSRARVLVMGSTDGRAEKLVVRCRPRLPHVKLLLPLGGSLEDELEACRGPGTKGARLERWGRRVRAPGRGWRRSLAHPAAALVRLALQAAGLYQNPFGHLDVPEIVMKRSRIAPAGRGPAES